MEQPQDYHISPNQLSISFTPGSTIIDLPKFLESHERFVTALKPGKARNAYQNRLEKVKTLIKEQNEKRD